MVAFGVNQIVAPNSWTNEYMPKWLKKIVHDPQLFMKIHGGGNLGLGLFLVSGIGVQVSVVATLMWWLTILPFAFYGSWKSGMRDLAIVSALAALAWLSLGGA